MSPLPWHLLTQTCRVTENHFVETDGKVTGWFILRCGYQDYRFPDDYAGRMPSIGTRFQGVFHEVPEREEPA